jgi:hypothetical protein
MKVYISTCANGNQISLFRALEELTCDKMQVAFDADRSERDNWLARGKQQLVIGLALYAGHWKGRNRDVRYSEQISSFQSLKTIISFHIIRIAFSRRGVKARCGIS